VNVLALLTRGSKPHERIDDKVTCATTTELTIRSGISNKDREVLSNQKRHNPGEDRAKYRGTDDPLPHIHRTTFPTATAGAVDRVRAVTRAGPGHRLILLGEVDRRRCDRRGKAGVHTGCDEDRSATRADRGRVWRREGNVEPRVERAGYRTSSVREDFGAGNIQVFITCGSSDEGKDVRECPVGCSEIVSRASVRGRHETYLLVSPRPSEPRPQFASTVESRE
jgi:hypothetical protein